MQLDDPSPDEALLRSAVSKVSFRILPVLGMLLFVSAMDRTSIGVAALTMNGALGISATQFGFASGIFLLAYCLLGIPSNIALARVGARLWFAAIMLAWGMVTLGTAFVSGASALYVNRFLLGLAEAGVAPGIFLCVTFWLPQRFRATGLAISLLAQPVASLVGNPIAGLLLGVKAGGLEGWQWLFVIEGAATMLLALLSYALLTDSPRSASWLSEAEKQVLETELRAPAGAAPSAAAGSLLDMRVLMLMTVAVASAAGATAVTYWMPQILKRLVGGSNASVSLLSAVPFGLSAAGMYALARLSDAKDMRAAALAATYLLSALAFALSALLPGGGAAACLIVAATANFAAIPIFWSLASSALSARAAAVGLATINVVGNGGAALAAVAVVALRDAYGSFTPVLLCLAVLLALAGLVVAGGAVRTGRLRTA